MQQLQRAEAEVEALQQEDVVRTQVGSVEALQQEDVVRTQVSWVEALQQEDFVRTQVSVQGGRSCSTYEQFRLPCAHRQVSKGGRIAAPWSSSCFRSPGASLAASRTARCASKCRTAARCASKRERELLQGVHPSAELLQAV